MEENRNEIYLLRKSLQHNHMSIVVIGRELTEEHSQTLYDLSKISDIFFIFSDKEVRTKDIIYKKFSNLYNALGYLIAPNDFGSGIMKILKYDLEIFKTSHLGVSIFNQTDGLNSSMLSNLVEVNNSTITGSILKIHRMDFESLKQIYTKKEESSWWNRIFKCSEKCDNDLIYSRYSTDGIIYLSKLTVRSMLGGYNTVEFNEYVESFSSQLYSHQYLIPSLIKSLGLKFIDNEINKLNIKSLTNANN